ncbi:MAG TPA: hypothetical protein DIW51_17750 [Rhodospirillaceae bacterium]|nr:hypothetical protein [Magnetovibrio sp.]HBT43263.1 hypothetical protein [Rhodospirillaceae bacterium]HCS71807.1 hypothetical protein [Rhodospirillaceae bacterium]|tara:strand:- start:155 stop:424 length:270 start_codon:yes stop_codon:yes gene_type:complete
MAFVSKDLSVLSYANGFTLWHYTSVDTAAVVDSAGYFNDAAHMLRTGDILVANVDTDGTPGAGLFLVSANAGGIVDVDDLTVVGGTDTD